MATNILPQQTGAQDGSRPLFFDPGVSPNKSPKIEKKRSKFRADPNLHQRNRLAAQLYVKTVLEDADNKVYHGQHVDTFGGASFDGFNDNVRAYFRQCLALFITKMEKEQAHG